MSRLVIDVTPELKQELQKQARKRSLPVSEYVRPALESLIPPSDDTYTAIEGPQAEIGAEGAVSPRVGEYPEPESIEEGEATRKPIWEVIVELMQDIPADELERLPADLSENLDHYLYGAPKRSA